MNQLTPAQMCARMETALEATWEIEAVTGCLLREIPTDADSLHLGSLLRRVHQLNGAIMSLMGDDNHPTEDLRKIVHCGPPFQ